MTGVQTCALPISSGNDINLNAVGQVTFGNLATLSTKTKSQLSGLTASTGSLAYCTDASGGACPVYYNGTSWLKIADNGSI